MTKDFGRMRAPCIFRSRKTPLSAQTLPQLRLYYLRVGFLASAYINQVGEKPATTLPHNLAGPLVGVARLLGRPPI